mgnify:CR=1 FL=1
MKKKILKKTLRQIWLIPSHRYVPEVYESTGAVSRKTRPRLQGRSKVGAIREIIDFGCFFDLWAALTFDLGFSWKNRYDFRIRRRILHGGRYLRYIVEFFWGSYENYCYVKTCYFPGTEILEISVPRIRVENVATVSKMKIIMLCINIFMFLQKKTFSVQFLLYFRNRNFRWADFRNFCSGSLKIGSQNGSRWFFCENSWKLWKNSLLSNFEVLEQSFRKITNS